ncbi:hypothetical protein MPER_05863, partial [Moniliophthora perniciosa FA553]
FDDYLQGCPKVTHRGISAVLAQNTNGIRGLGIEGLSPHFDMHQFRLTCAQTNALSQLRSITLTISGVHQQASLNQWMREVTDDFGLTLYRHIKIASKNFLYAYSMVPVFESYTSIIH